MAVRASTFEATKGVPAESEGLTEEDPKKNNQMKKILQLIADVVARLPPEVPVAKISASRLLAKIMLLLPKEAISTGAGAAALSVAATIVYTMPGGPDEVPLTPPRVVSAGGNTPKEFTVDLVWTMHPYPSDRAWPTTARLEPLHGVLLPRVIQIIMHKAQV